MKKYELIESNVDGLFRVRALKNFNDVKVGDIGGYIEKEYNLSHRGDCWIYDDAKVFCNARIFDNAKAFNNVEIYGNSQVFNNAMVYGNAIVYGCTEIFGNAMVYGDAEVYGNAGVYDDARILGNAQVLNNAKIYGNVKIYGDAKVYGNTQIYSNAQICHNATVDGNIKIDKGIHIGYIDETFKKILYIQCQNRLITVYKDLNDIIKCNIGCQTRMTLEDLLKRIKKDGGIKPHRQEYVNIMQNANLLLG